MRVVGHVGNAEVDGEALSVLEVDQFAYGEVNEDAVIPASVDERFLCVEEAVGLLKSAVAVVLVEDDIAVFGEVTRIVGAVLGLAVGHVAVPSVDAGAVSTCAGVESHHTAAGRIAEAVPIEVADGDIGEPHVGMEEAEFERGVQLRAVADLESFDHDGVAQFVHIASGGIFGQGHTVFCTGDAVGVGGVVIVADADDRSEGEVLTQFECRRCLDAAVDLVDAG